jgi:hypothetical protein
MKFKNSVKLEELWFFRLAAVLGWVVSNVIILGTIGNFYALNLWDGFIFFSIVVAAQTFFYLMLKLMEKPEIEDDK